MNDANPTSTPVTDPGFQEALPPTIGPAIRVADPDATVNLGRRIAPQQRAENSSSQPTQSSLRSARYRSLDLLGQGAFGVVEKSLDHQLERVVAIKHLQEERVSTPSARELFLHEAKITGQLQHPGIVPVHEISDDASGAAFYVMRMLEGETLSVHIKELHARLRSIQPTRLERRKQIRPLLMRFIDICQTIAYAHRQGVMHRDIKPDNIMVGSFAETCVVDWGLAKRFSVTSTAEAEAAPADCAANAARRGAIVGTPGYMSPEQSYGDTDNVGPGSDIYSLGCLLYEILTGVAPIRDTEIDTVLRRTRMGNFPSPSNLQPDLDHALVAICQKAMQTRPLDRYRSAEALADDVAKFVADESVSVYRESRSEKIMRWCRHHHLVTVQAAVAICMMMTLIALAGILAESYRREERLAKRTVESIANSSLRQIAATREELDGLLNSLHADQFDSLEPALQSSVQSILQSYEAFVRESQGTPETNALVDRKLRLQWDVEQAHCLLHLARWLASIGRTDDAREYSQRLTSKLDQLPPADTSAVSVLRAQAADLQALLP